MLSKTHQIMIKSVRTSYSLYFSPWVGDTVEARVLQHLVAVDTQRLGDAKVLSARGIDGSQQVRRLYVRRKYVQGVVA